MDLIAELEKRAAALKAELEGMLQKSITEDRSLDETEEKVYAEKADERRKLLDRVAEMREDAAREAAADQTRAAAGTVESRVAVTSEPNPVYRADNTHEVSYFRDLFNASRGQRGALDRLSRSQETRAGDLTTVAGAGGDFAPPEWLVDQFIALARPGRVFADLLHHEVLPSGVSSINLPKVATGSATGAQATQNTALTDTAMTTGAVSGAINTIGGKQIVSMQLLEQSGIPFDRVILADLTADYAKQLDAQVVGNVVGTSGIISVTDSAAAPGVTAADVYGDVANAVQQVATNRYLPPTHIVMTPARWYWLVSQVDSQNRPLVVPNGPAFNQLAESNGNVAQGLVGTMLGLPVYLDPQVATAAASAHEIVLARFDDLWLFESPLQSASFDATYADQASVLFRVLAYNAFICRYSKSVAQIGGAGYTAPTFA